MTEDPTLTDEELAPASAAYQVRFKRIEDLAAFERNARTHSAAQVAQLAAAVRAFGFTNPVLADETGVIAGHGRIAAAMAIYAEGGFICAGPPGSPRIPHGTVPVRDIAGLSANERRQLILADNQIALNAGWDNDLLRLELNDLAALDLDLGLLGFDAGALDALFKTEAPEPEGQGEDDPPLNEPEAPTIIHCPACQHQFSVLKEEPVKPKRKKAA